MITWFGWALVVGLEQAGSSPTPQEWLPILPHGRVVTGTITKVFVWGKKTNGTEIKTKKMVYLFIYFFRILRIVPSPACWIRPVAAALPFLFSLIDGAALLLTFPQEHFTCSRRTGPRPPSSSSESQSWCPDILALVGSVWFWLQDGPSPSCLLAEYSV